MRSPRKSRALPRVLHSYSWKPTSLVTRLRSCSAIHWCNPPPPYSFLSHHFGCILEIHEDSINHQLNHFPHLPAKVSWCDLPRPGKDDETRPKVVAARHGCHSAAKAPGVESPTWRVGEKYHISIDILFGLHDQISQWYYIYTIEIYIIIHIYTYIYICIHAKPPQKKRNVTLLSICPNPCHMTYV